MKLQTLTHAPFLLRWTLANMLGWGLGMLLGALFLGVFDSFIGLFLASILTATCAGLAQSLLIHDRRWVLISAVGGAVAVIPTLLVALASAVAGTLLIAFVVGAVYGGIFGTLQWAMIHHIDQFGLWIVANAVAGGLCGCLSLNFNPLGLPLFCSIGPAVFGLLTGLVLRQLMPPAG